MFRRYLAFRPTEVGGAYRHLEEVQRGCPGHGPLHALVASAARIGFEWPGLSNLVCLIQHFTSAILYAWRCWVSADLCLPVAC